LNQGRSRFGSYPLKSFRDLDLLLSMQNYHIYDLSIDSDLDLPANRAAKMPNHLSKSLIISHQPDTLQEFAQVHWISSRYGGLVRCYDVQSGILVCIKDDNNEQFRFHVSYDESELTFNIFCSVAPAVIANLGLSIYKLLQGYITLHGIAVGMGSKLAAVVARSQTGKSTLMWSLMDCGAQLASDDVLPIHVQGGSVVATPSVSLHTKLSKEALIVRDMDWTQLQPISPESDLFWLPFAQDKRIIAERSLDAVFILQPTQQIEKNTVHVQRVTGGAAISLLLENTHGPWAAYPMLNGKEMFDAYAVLAEVIPVYVLNYVRCYEILPRLVDTINNQMHSGR